MLTIRILEDDYLHNMLDRKLGLLEGHIDQGYLRWEGLEAWWHGDYQEAPYIYYRATTPAGELWLMMNLHAAAEIVEPTESSQLGSPCSKTSLCPP